MAAQPAVGPLEVKLQTSPTIDLGLVDPHSEQALDMPPLDGIPIRHCDVRYAVFGATSDGHEVALNRLIVTTGEMSSHASPSSKAVS